MMANAACTGDIHSGFVDGAIEEAILVRGVAVFRGWVRVRGEFGPPSAAMLLVDDEASDMDLAPWIVRSASDSDASVIQFEARGRDQAFRYPYSNRSLKIALVDTNRKLIILRIPESKQDAFLDYSDKHLYYKKIQNLASRIKHPETLIEHAKRFFCAHMDDSLLRASAIVVIGYRFLENPNENESLRHWFESHIDEIKDTLSSPKTHIEFRWMLSVTLVQSYILFPNNKNWADKYIEELQSAFDLRDAIEQYSPQATNMLKLTFLLGSVLWHTGQKEKALSVLRSAPQTLKCASRGWPFDSYHSAAEYIASAQITRACLIRAEQLRTLDTGVVHDESYQLAKIYDFQCLGAPLFDFVKANSI